MASRSEIAQSTARKLRDASSRLSSIKATIGVDGFVDEIIAVVDKRKSIDDFEPVHTIDQLGKKILAAAGQSSNYELVPKHMKLGGNGPIMANALASAGMGVTYLGCLGFPALHPVFNEFAKRANVISIADPGHTDALEFEDGKLMFGKLQTLRDVNWANLIERVGIEKLTQSIGDSSLVGMVNWTMLPFLSDIWRKLSSDVFPKLPKRDRIFFVDLADPEKRTHDDLRGALSLLTTIQSQLNVILGLNRKEAGQVTHVLGLPAPGDDETSLQNCAAAIREKLNLHCVMVHPRRGAAAATSDGTRAWFVGPFVKEPKISTGAGDHFNAGFCLGRVLGLTLEESLCTGVATSGYYVRSAESPTAKQLADFAENLPDPQG